MELQNFETEYLFDKDLSYFEDYNLIQKSASHVYVADTIQEVEDTLEELNLPEAMLYNSTTDSFDR